MARSGTAIGEAGQGPVDRRETDAASMYDKLERIIVPLFYNVRNAYVDMMRQSIALNGSFFNSHRMLGEYLLKACI